MKRKLLFSAQIVLVTLFIFSLVAAIFELSGASNPLARLDHNDNPPYNHIEAYDPSLSRLNSIKKLEQYCDSIYSEMVFTGAPVDFESTYTDIVSSAVRNRFFHGYSYYGYGDNYIATVFSNITIPGLKALVIPNEILKYPYAACSQQSIVMMEVLQDKGFKTRKVAFQGKTYGGHFAFEVFYDNLWHFHDPNMEPDKTLLDSYGRPGIDFLARNPEILVKAYSQFSKERVLDIFPNYSYGPVNKFPAPKAIVFQRVTQFLSYSMWAFFLIAFVVVRRKYVRAGKKVKVGKGLVPDRKEQDETAPVYYPGFTAQGN